MECCIGIAVAYRCKSESEKREGGSFFYLSFIQALALRFVQASSLNWYAKSCLFEINYFRLLMNFGIDEYVFFN
jgi:hypothetical protein